MRFDIITLLPEMFAALNCGITGRALENNLAQIQYWNPRDYTKDKYRKVDDHSYGGGPGMVMLAQPLSDAIMAAKNANSVAKIVYLSPQGRLLDQAALQDFARQPGLILVAGRYEGIDERVVASLIDEEWSLGDYVLSGGELAAMVMLDGIIRLLPGALGDEDSAAQDSFMADLLDYPHFTRPENFDGKKVPDVLLSGNHKAIARWRLQQALGRTYLRRRGLLEKRGLTAEEQELLAEFLAAV
jgi:tRNA (guanine37-N1)-methyltransferase